MTDCPHCAELLETKKHRDALIANRDALKAQLDRIADALDKSQLPLGEWVTIADMAVEELTTLRATNTRLNRRCQSAERGLQAKLTSGVSFGRALANSAAVMWHEKYLELKALLCDLLDARRCGCHVEPECDARHEERIREALGEEDAT